MPDHRPQITDDFANLCDIVAKLRAPDGCPWDREQTNESLLPALIEEAYETAEAARAQDDAHFREELGDLLLLVVMHAQIARETGRFDIEEVIGQVSEKLIRRHPHVFGTSEARDAGAVLKQWEAIKREEKNADLHYLATLPKALPALVRAQKAQSKAARVNFDWTALRDVMAKLEEELRETKEAIRSQQQERIEDEVGDLLFAVVNLARKCKIDAETALQSATDKFVARFNRLEDELKTRGKKLGEVDLAEMDAIWNDIKAKSSRSNAKSSHCKSFECFGRSSVGCCGVCFSLHCAFAIFRLPMNLLINLCLVLFVLVAALMVLVILMQRPKSEGLGAAFGGGVTENIFGAQTTNVLVKFTTWLAGIFFALTFALSVLYAHHSVASSAFRRELMKNQAAPQTSPAPAGAQSSPGSSPGITPAQASTAVSPAASAAPTGSPKS